MNHLTISPYPSLRLVTPTMGFSTDMEYGITYCAVMGYVTSDTLSALWVNRESKAAHRLAAFFSLSAVALTALIAFTFPQVATASTVSSVDLQVISQIESSNNPRAIGDGGKALGLFQIHPAVVQDFNKFTGAKLSHRDMLKPDHARTVADWYLNKRIPQILRAKRLPDTPISRLRAYNEGFLRLINGREPSPITRGYIAKYERISGRKL